MVFLILSLDYEIFGNGSGDVRRDMIEPTERLLDICNRYNAKLSIMAEMAEYWAMKEALEYGEYDIGYCPITLIDEQIKNAVLTKHDVQLHLHPWWIQARLDKGSWRLNPSYYRITDLPKGVGKKQDLLSATGALFKGKETLENLISTVDPSYECIVYRAAMFWGQPSRELIKAMKQAGFVADTSVIKGHFDPMPAPTDYRHAESSVGYWWTKDDDLAVKGPVGEQVIELPVYSEIHPYLYNFRWTKLKTTLKRRKVEQDNAHGHGMMTARKSSEPRGRILKKLLSQQALKYDFCKLSSRNMIQGLKRAIRYDQIHPNSAGTPMVMLGHSKDFWNDCHLDSFLKHVRENEKGKVIFSTLRDCVQRIMQKGI